MSIYDDFTGAVKSGYNNAKDFFGGSDDATSSAAPENPPLIVTKSTRLKKLEDKLGEGKRRYKILKFPLDVDTAATQNIFLININAQSGSLYKDKAFRVVEGETPVVEQSGSGSLSRKFRGNTNRIDSCVALYMPAEIQTNYQANWKNSELGAVGAVIDAFTGMGDLASFQTYKDIFNTSVSVAPTYIGMTAAAIGQALTPFNIKDAYSFGTHTALNPYMEVIFEGVTNRTFSFTFKFIPRSQEEQNEIRKIVQLLKFHRAPEKKISGVNSIWNYPSTFDISFLNKQGQENNWLFKISTCAMTDFNVKYGSDNHFATFEDGSPFSTTITMSFTEMELLDKDRHLDGF